MRILDLYSGAGGAGTGYTRAGFTVVGVDIDPQPAYPHTFWRIDAIHLLERLLDGARYRVGTDTHLGLTDFDMIHASPPCQFHSALTAGNRSRGWTDDHVDLIPDTRKLLDATGLPYVIENVQGAPVRRDMTLCGEMFGLSVIRHRYFELGGWRAAAPAHLEHRGRVRGWRHGVFYDGPYFAVHGDGGGKGTVEEWQKAMDIEWMTTKHDLAEAIPPAYTEYVGRQFMAWMSDM